MLPPPPPPPDPGPGTDTGVTAWPDPGPITVPPATLDRIHIVKPKDTLYAICRLYYGAANKGLVARIMDANPAITDPNVIKVGQKIVVPE